MTYIHKSINIKAINRGRHSKETGEGIKGKTLISRLLKSVIFRGKQPFRQKGEKRCPVSGFFLYYSLVYSPLFCQQVYLLCKTTIRTHPTEFFLL